MSRQQCLRAQLRRKEDQITRMRGVLRLLQSGSDLQAAELVLRLRSNSQVEKTIHAKKGFLHRWVHNYSHLTRNDSEQAAATKAMRERTFLYNLHVTRFQNRHPNRQSVVTHALIQTLYCMKTRSR